MSLSSAFHFPISCHFCFFFWIYECEFCSKNAFDVHFIFRHTHIQIHSHTHSENMFSLIYIWSLKITTCVISFGRYSNENWTSQIQLLLYEYWYIMHVDQFAFCIHDISDSEWYYCKICMNRSKEKSDSI